MGHLGLKMGHPHNSGFTINIVLQFCTMKEVKRDMEIIVIVFLKKKLFGTIWSFGPKMGSPHNFGSGLGFF